MDIKINSTVQPLQPTLPPKLAPRPGIRWRYEIGQYGTAFGVALVLFILFSVYLYYRRGYYDLYIVNKIFAGDAAILLGLALLLGPLNRLFNAFDRYLQYRKEIGIVAFALALMHGLSSLFFLPDHFTWSRYLGSGLWPFLFGLACLIVLLGLFFISDNRSIKALGAKVWWALQTWGARLAFVLLALHVGIMKIPGWLDWYQNGGNPNLRRPDWPGAGSLVGMFLAFVVFVRLAEFGGKTFGRAIWYAGLILLATAYIFTFWWGRQFAG